MSLFRKKCDYCGGKIDKGKEIERSLKVPGFSSLHKKYFCNDKHAIYYEREVNENLKNSKEGSCCG